MPNRIIKDSINESRGLSNCSFFAQDLYKRLLTYADDYGRFNADPQIMVARLYVRELAVVSVEDIIDCLIELAGVGKIGFYTAAPKREVYGAFPSWNEHQRIRDSKKNKPDPTDTSVNDWYLRRYIPIEMKIAVIERDGFKCQICGKHVAESISAERLVKMGTGMFHFDHVVPCHQGGRATMENIRLTCPKCNLSRKKTFDYNEILKFAEIRGDFPQVAASCGELRPNPIQSNPIQIQSVSESKSNPNPKARARDPEPQPFKEPETTIGIDRAFDAFWAAYPLHKSKVKAYEAFQALNPDSKLLEAMILAIQKQKNWRRMRDGYIPMPATWIRERRWEDDEEPELKETKPRRVLAGQDYEQREYKESEMREILGVDSIFRADDPDSMFNEG